MDFEKHLILWNFKKTNEKFNCYVLQENIEIEQGMTKCKVCSKY